MKLKDRICEMEFSNLFLVIFWTFAVAVGIAVVLFIMNLVVVLGSLEPRVESRRVESQQNETLLISYEFQIEPEKISDPVGCEYWNNYIDTMEANGEERAWLKRMVFCESTCNPYAVSRAGATGLIQFMPSTFRANGGTDINNPYEQLQIGLEMYRMGQAYQWCCK